MMDDAHDYNTVPLPLEQETVMAIASAEVNRQEEVFDLPVPLKLLPTSPFYGYDDGEDPEAADEQEAVMGAEQTHQPEPMFTFSPDATRTPFSFSLSSWLRSDKMLRHLILLVGGAVLILGLSVGAAFAQNRMGQNPGVTFARRYQGNMQEAKKPVRPQLVLAHATATPLSQNSTVVAQDNFQHDANTASWTTASDGKSRWEGDVGNGDFTLQNGVGLIAQSQKNRAVNGLYLTALLGSTWQDSTITAEMTLQDYRSDLQANDGVVLRYKNPSPATGNQSQYYKAYLDGEHLIVLRKSAGVMTILKSTPFQTIAGQRYTLTFSANGSQLIAQAWQTTNGNPGTLSQNNGTGQKVTLQVQDSTLTSGQDGLRILTQPDTQVQVFSVTITQVQPQKNQQEG
jgi:hypothetical protein